MTRSATLIAQILSQRSSTVIVRIQRGFFLQSLLSSGGRGPKGPSYLIPNHHVIRNQTFVQTASTNLLVSIRTLVGLPEINPSRQVGVKTRTRARVTVYLGILGYLSNRRLEPPPTLRYAVIVGPFGPPPSQPQQAESVSLVR